MSLAAPIREVEIIAPAIRAPSLETIGMTKIFGSLVALEDVSIKVEPGTVHALLGENGAGKSTLVKCIMGYYSPDRGQVLLDGEEVPIRNPRDARAYGIGMVYQHFTLVPSLTGAENLVISRADAPAIIDWKKEMAALNAFLDRMPFRVPLDVPVAAMAAGPSVAAAPALFSTITGWPRSLATISAMARIIASCGAPGPRGEITVIGRLG